MEALARECRKQCVQTVRLQQALCLTDGSSCMRCVLSALVAARQRPLLKQKAFGTLNNFASALAGKPRSAASNLERHRS